MASRTASPRSIAYATPSEKAPLLFKAEQAALGRVGIKIDRGHPGRVDVLQQVHRLAEEHIKQQGIGVAVAGWGADFPTGVGFFNSITNGNHPAEPGNSNYSSLNDPTVNAVLNEAPEGKTTEADWQKLNHAVMDGAVYLPFLWEKTLLLPQPADDERDLQQRARVRHLRLRQRRSQLVRGSSCLSDQRKAKSAMAGPASQPGRPSPATPR